MPVAVNGSVALFDVTALFLRLGVTAFGGPAAHVALIERECVVRRQWLSHAEFADLLGISSLIPGPTSTELAMHVGKRRAGWPGLVLAGLAFIMPAALLVLALAALYARSGELPAMRAVLAAIRPVVLVIMLQALVPLARSTVRSVPLAMLALATGILSLAGIPELRVLLLAGVAHLLVSRGGALAIVLALAASGTAATAQALSVSPPVADVFAYFVRVGALLFGSGYVLLPILHDDLVTRLHWLTEQQLIDAVAAGQATPGPVFTTATFVGFLLGGPWAAAAATVAIFLPAFVFSALSSLVFDRLRASRLVRSFLDGVNAAAVALIAVVVMTLARAVITDAMSIVVTVAAGVALLVARLNPLLVLAVAAGAGVFVQMVRG